METILKTGYTKIFSLFYPQKMISLHLREIARKTKLNVHSTSRILFSLEKEAILKIDTNNAENETEALTGIKINVLQISLQEFKKELKIKEDHIIQTALKTGYPITNHIFFYEVYFHENI